MDALLEARLDGLEAGRLNLSSGVNPHRVGSAPWNVWEHARSSVQAQKAALLIQQRARTCRYGHGSCECGGRGYCLDVA